MVSMDPPNVIVKPPRSFSPVTFQFPRTQNSPNRFSKFSEKGLATVTSWPSRLSQKSRPNLVGCNVGFEESSRVLLFGTERNPSPELSSEESCWVGGLLFLPSTKGVTELFCEIIVMLPGKVISVKVRSLGAVDERNSDTRPDRDTRSPTVTWPRIVVFCENTMSP